MIRSASIAVTPNADGSYTISDERPGDPLVVRDVLAADQGKPIGVMHTRVVVAAGDAILSLDGIEPFLRTWDGVKWVEKDGPDLAHYLRLLASQIDPNR